MSTLRIRLFGAPSIESDTNSPPKMTRSVGQLLCYLLLNRDRTIAREALMGIFWGDHSEQQARSCLNTTIWRLRRVLEPDEVVKGSFLIRTPDDEVGFNTQSDFWLDLAEFEEKANRILPKPVHAMTDRDARDLERIHDLYHGDLMEGCYQDWAVVEQERVRTLYMRSLIQLMNYRSARGDYTAAVSCGRKILELDPLREGVHRALMRLHIESGERVEAIRQYERCRRALKLELGIQPMEETQSLYQSLVLNAGLHEKPGKSVTLAGLRSATRRFGTAIAELNSAWEEFTHAIRGLQDNGNKGRS